MRTKKHQRVLVAMSGGVDSSVAAALLAEQGYDCIGAFFITWTQDVAGVTRCPWERDVFDARRVCSRLGIPLYTFDFETEYRQHVVDYLFREYQSGRTPNPDVMCNREIKFNLFWREAQKLGADAIATGHYARVVTTNDQYQLHKGIDRNKDQSYFLYRLINDDLEHVILPLGDLTKPAVRALAKKFSLPNWDKKDSQGICFLGEVKLRDFLKTRIRVTPGQIVTTEGTPVGRHEGTAFYTIGQRRGLNIGGAGQPYYVVAKDQQTNTLVVSKKMAAGATRSQLTAREITWVNKQPTLPLACTAKIRYRQSDQAVTLEKTEQGIEVSFKNPQPAISPGQSVVFYRQTQVLGGGIIEK